MLRCAHSWNPCWRAPWAHLLATRLPLPLGARARPLLALPLSPHVPVPVAAAALVAVAVYASASLLVIAAAAIGNTSSVLEKQVGVVKQSAFTASLHSQRLRGR